MISDYSRKQVKQQQPKREGAIDHQRAPMYGKNLPKKVDVLVFYLRENLSFFVLLCQFLDRYQMFLERSVAHRNQLVTKIEQDTARVTERQMEIQHRLHKPEQHEERYDGKIIL